MGERDELLDAATDYALRCGVVDLTFGAVAEAIGTTYDVLVRHFVDRDGLAAAIIDHAEIVAIAKVDLLSGEPSVKEGVLTLWRAFQESPVNEVAYLYMQATSTGLLGREPYRSLIEPVNAEWQRVLINYFLRCGAPRDQARRIALLVDGAIHGFLFILANEHGEEVLAQVVNDLAAAAELIAGEGDDRDAWYLRRGV